MRRVKILLVIGLSLLLASPTAQGSGLAKTRDRKLIPMIWNTGSRSTPLPVPTPVRRIGARARRATVNCIDVGNDPSPMFTVTLTYKCANGNLTGFQGCYGACVAPTAVPGAAPAVPRPVNVAAIVNAAMSQVPEPEPETSPPLVRGDEYGVVGIPFFFAVPEAQWRPVSPTATDGAKFLTITATPSRLSFDPGDGSSAPSCDSAGRRVRTADQAKRAKELGCFHLYQVAAPAAGYGAKLSILWKLDVTTNLDEKDYVNLVPATMTTTTDIVVPIVEIQAVLANPAK